jgi:hypothetical protein
MVADDVFASEIEKIKNEKEVSYIDAVLLWCEEHQCEVESVAHTIKADPVLKEKLLWEAANAHLLKVSTPTGNTLL